MRRTSNVGRKFLCIGLLAISIYLLLNISYDFQTRHSIRVQHSGRRWVVEHRQPTSQKRVTRTLIPRIIHQTYKTRELSQNHWQAVQSWKIQNPEWVHKFYDDAACQAFVEDKYPQWLPAYRAMPLAVERADLFRYLIVLHYGGVYADVDTECGRPLDEVIQPTDSFIAGWENEFPTAQQAVNSNFARQRQLEQWIFAAEPNHPALQALCERLVANAFLPFNESMTDALFRTGPGPFTDEVLKTALARDTLRSQGVRILPRVTLGGLPGGWDGMGLWEEPSRLVAHLHMGSWKRAGFKRRAWLMRMAEGDARALLNAPSNLESPHQLYPVSVPTKPAFTVMTHLKSRDKADINSQITTWGHPLAPGNYLLQQPVYQKFLSALQETYDSDKVLLDVGAGIGFYSLASAAAGWQTEAFEAGQTNLQSLQASVAYNAMSSAIAVNRPLPTQKRLAAQNPHKPYSGRCSAPAINASRATLDLLKIRLPKLQDSTVGALRIGLPGLEGEALRILQARLEAPKLSVLLLEVYPQLVGCSAAGGSVQTMLQQLQLQGFDSIQHMGVACMRRKTTGMWRQGLWTSLLAQLIPYARRALEQTLASAQDFEWCSYDADAFKAWMNHLGGRKVPEVFLLRKGAGQSLPKPTITRVSLNFSGLSF